MKVQKLRTLQAARPLVLVAVIAAISGCGVMQRNTTDESPQPITSSSGAVQHSFSNAEVVASWQQAEVARQSGDFMGAFRHLRKALELEPSDPVVWSRLAEMALRLNKPEPAEKYADRSNLLANGNNTLVYRNWLIIQRAREVNNDIAGAEQALVKANQFRP